MLKWSTLIKCFQFIEWSLTFHRQGLSNLKKTKRFISTDCNIFVKGVCFEVYLRPQMVGNRTFVHVNCVPVLDSQTNYLVFKFKGPQSKYP